jgi:23S rRNA (adenine2503-C2)-methyltransferase
MEGGKMRKKTLLDYGLKDLKKAVADCGFPEYRGKQVWDWLYKGAEHIGEMKNLPAPIINRLEEDFVTGIPRIVKKRVSALDGTAKYLVEYSDGSMVECVYLLYRFGRTVCVSSQVGCRIGCSFCASTKGGLVRSLSSGEIIGQVLAVQRDAGERITNVVVMGSGEPMDNFENIVGFIRLLGMKEGLNIGLRHITVSTCGLVPEIKRLADLRLPITLSVSLHAADDETRLRLMPVARNYKIKEVLEGCRYYAQRTGRRITFEYALVEGVNDSPGDAAKLANLLKGMLCNVNLIPVNPIEGAGFRQPGHARIKAFRRALEDKGIAVTVRREMGRDIAGACGQLKAGYKKGENS